MTYLRRWSVRKGRESAQARGSEATAAHWVEGLERRWLLSVGGKLYHSLIQFPTSGSFDMTDGPLAATAVDNKALVMSADGTDVLIYNAKTDHFAEHPLQLSRRYVAATAVGHKAFFAGGGVPNTGGSPLVPVLPTDQVDVYDDQTGEWSTAHLSAARIGITAVSVGDKALFAAGNVDVTVGSAFPLKTVDIYDDATGQWSTAQLTQTAESVSAVAVGDRAVFVGSGNVVDVYDAATDEWSTITVPASLQSEDYFSQITAAPVGDHQIAFVSGIPTGRRHPGMNAAIYDFNTQRWSTHLLSGAQSIGSTVTGVGNTAVFEGGTGLADVYDGRTGRWSVSAGAPTETLESTGSVGQFGVFVPFPLQNHFAGVYDTRRGAWSQVPISSDSIVAKVRDELILMPQHGQNATLDVFSTSPPRGALPIGGSGELDAAPSLYAWTAVRGATSYDLHVDGNVVRGLTGTQWSSTFGVSPGRHTWYVTAHVGDMTIGGPSAEFDVAAPPVQATVEGAQGVTFPLQPGETGSVDVLVKVTGALPKMPTKVDLAFYAYHAPQHLRGATLIGHATVTLPALALANAAQARVTVTIAVPNDPSVTWASGWLLATTAQGVTLVDQDLPRFAAAAEALRR